VHGLGVAEGDFGIVDGVARVPAKWVVAIRQYGTPASRLMLVINQAR
jgi:hypothetical protein